MNDFRGLLYTVYTDRMQQAQVKYEVCQVTVTLVQLVRVRNRKGSHHSHSRPIFGYLIRFVCGRRRHWRPGSVTEQGLVLGLG